MLAAVDRNTAAGWEALLAGSPVPARVAAPGLVMLSSGLPVPLFNPAFLTGAPGDPAGAVARVVGHYRGLGTPFVVYFRDEVAPGVAEACAAAGLVEHWRPACMVMDPVPAGAPAPPAGLDVAPVGPAALADYAAVAAAAFGLAPDVVRALFGPALLDLPGFTGFLGTVAGRPVATSGVYVSDGVAGVVNVATLEDCRGRGFGAALTWAAVAAGTRAGAARSALVASEQGEPVYRRMGYATPARYRQFEQAP